MELNGAAAFTEPTPRMSTLTVTGGELHTNDACSGKKKYARSDSGRALGALKVDGQVKYDERHNDSVKKCDGVAVGEEMSTRRRKDGEHIHHAPTQTCAISQKVPGHDGARRKEELVQHKACDSRQT